MIHSKIMFYLLQDGCTSREAQGQEGVDSPGVEDQQKQVEQPAQ